MNPMILFLIRLVLAILIAFVLIRFFYPSAGAGYVAALAAFLFAAGYGFEYLRKQKPRS